MEVLETVVLGMEISTGGAMSGWDWRVRNDQKGRNGIVVNVSNACRGRC